MKRNWKTSLAGVLGGLLLAVGPNLGARLAGDSTAPPITTGNVAAGVALALLGLSAKDGDVTGGSRKQ